MGKNKPSPHTTWTRIGEPLLIARLSVFLVFLNSCKQHRFKDFQKRRRDQKQVQEEEDEEEEEAKKAICDHTVLIVRRLLLPLHPCNCVYSSKCNAVRLKVKSVLKDKVSFGERKARVFTVKQLRVMHFSCQATMIHSYSAPERKSARPVAIRLELCLVRS